MELGSNNVHSTRGQASFSDKGRQGHLQVCVLFLSTHPPTDALETTITSSPKV